MVAERIRRGMASGRRISCLAKVLRCSGATLMAVGAVAVNSIASASASTHSQPTGRGSSLHLAGAPPRIPVGSADEGAPASSTPLQVDVLLNPRDPTRLAAMAASVSDPGSPMFRRYLKPGQFAKEFAPTPRTIASVVSALQHQGLDPGQVTSNGMEIPIHTTAKTAESAFQVQLHQYRLPGGRLAYANTGAPSVPAAMSAAIAGVVGLDDLYPPLPNNIIGRVSGALPNSTSTIGTLSDPCGNGNFSATPGDLAAAYGFSGLYNEGDLGAGATVGLFELSGYSSSDISTYEACYGSSATVTNPNGTVAVNGGVGEVTGDIEFVASMAPKSKILVYESNDYMTDWNNIVGADAARVVSTSWSGGCEPNSTVQTAENTDLMEAAVQGQTIFAATGDGGSEDCNQGSKTIQSQLAVQDPGSQPYITGVGGTQYSNPPSYGPPPAESGWSGSTGGISITWPMPTWQAGQGVINSYTSGSPCTPNGHPYCREVPDVSALAGYPGLPFYCTAGTAMGECNNAGWQSFYGTSAAAPTWGAFAALTDSSCSSIEPNGIGFINPLIYQLEAGPKGAGAGYFNDITSGDNDALNADSGAYPATIGYDMVTGLGTPVGVPLAGGLCHAPVVDVTVTGTQSTVGGAISFTDNPPGSLPSGVTGIAGTIGNCSTSVSPSSPAGAYYGTITGCEGLTLSGPDATDYSIFYEDGGVTILKQISSTTTVSSVPNPSTFGESVTLTATVSPSDGGGSVTFYYDGGAEQVPCSPPQPESLALVSGTTYQAMCTTSSLPVGTDLITATYSGDTDTAGSSGSLPGGQAVNPAPTTTTLVSSSPNPTIHHQAVTLTATVTPTDGMGTVTFYAGTKAICKNVMLMFVGGTTYQTTPPCVDSSLTVGTHKVTAVYSGDMNYLGSTSPVLVQKVKAYGAPAFITPVSGTPQSSPVGVAFAQPLTAVVSDLWGNPVPGAQVTFTAPSTGPSGTFIPGFQSAMAATGSTGRVTAPVFTANLTVGGPYDVTASIGAVSGSFVLTNLPPVQDTAVSIVPAEFTLTGGGTTPGFLVDAINTGMIPTSGTLTVTDTISGGLSFTGQSLAGADKNGWNCTFAGAGGDLYLQRLHSGGWGQLRRPLCRCHGSVGHGAHRHRRSHSDRPDAAGQHRHRSSTRRGLLN